jgi:hypothetical protein
MSAEKETYKSPLSIVVPTDWWPVENKAQQELVESFVADIEATHHVEKTEVSIKDLWREKTPAKADSSDLTKYLENVSGMTSACVAMLIAIKVGVTSFCYGVYEELRQFREDYHAEYSKEPYVNPTMRWRW